MKIEIAIPCYNEEPTIAKVITDFRAAVPEAEIVVYNNNSTDRSAEFAQKAGAQVIKVNRRGKGYVVRAIFEASKADIVLIVDGDDTYEALDAHALIRPLIAEEADMTVGMRLLREHRMQFRRMHFLGNRVITAILNFGFKTSYSDILSGYRAFTRKFIRNVPLISSGFEVETELIIQALENGMTVKEVPIAFRKRPEGSVSKLGTISDGYRILMAIVSMLRDHRPFLAFSVISIIQALVGISMWLFGFFYPQQGIWCGFLRNIGGLFIVLAMGFFLAGLILNTINVRVHELSSLLKRK